MKATRDQSDQPPLPAAGEVPKQSDFHRALDLSTALGIGTNSNDLWIMTVPGAPWSKSRPRFTRQGRAYPAKGEVDAEKRTAAYMRQSVAAPLAGNVAVGCLFFRPNRQRIDVDNLLKHVCDAARGIFWADDSQCTALMGVLELDVDRPRTVIVLGRHVSTMLRGDDATYPCTVCGSPITMAGQGKRVKTCSRECASGSRGHQLMIDVEVPCAHCGKPFTRVSRYRTMCSAECRQDSLRGRNKSRGRPNSRCTTCGKELAHKRGGRCRGCWAAAPADNAPWHRPRADVANCAMCGETWPCPAEVERRVLVRPADEVFGLVSGVRVEDE